ncbi:Gfo/Idh/MocA family oxidoreductase [Sphingomonas swuensis]|uniref:Gfo/Idh/MocA family oxidoreductase n=1 Tax=Sphingomonas swuensis TaxID=977800 RepID=A0ABP7SH28_9SPHN
MSDKPRLGFLGIGWIGRNRMEAMLGTGLVEVAAIADPSHEMREEAAALVPDAVVAETLDELLTQDLDGLVVATPSAQHAEQSIRALEAGLAVFCQKPLGRTAAEARAVVDAARAADKLLGVDLSYRFTNGMRAIRRAIASGDLGQPFAADLVFHNAYGPGKDWFFDPAQSGGGCVIDLGVHLVDLALWAMEWPEVVKVESHLMSGGKPLADAATTCEDYAVATLTLGNGAVVRLACSWKLPAGKMCEIAADFYGTGGGGLFRNVGGSYTDFEAFRTAGTERWHAAEPDSDWGGRAAADWARRLASGSAFDPEAERLVEVARVLDAIYQR